MPTVIPSSGEQTFAIQAQNMAELNRLLTTQLTASSLVLNIAGEPVAFLQVSVLDILPLTPVQGIDIISVRLSYGSRLTGPSAVTFQSSLSGASPGGAPFWSALSPATLQQQQALLQSQQFDMLQSQSIVRRIQADSAGREQERWAQMQQLQSQIFQITQDVTVNKTNNANRQFSLMDGYIRN